MRVAPYSHSEKALWDDFVRQSKNGTFLFYRDYMDYHADRFTDYSLLFFDDADQLVALLPATRHEGSLSSHRGLTYGGFVTNEVTKLPAVLQVFEAALAHLRAEGFSEFIYKTIPHIYHRLPAEEDRYALFLCNAHILRCGVMTVIDGRRRPSFQERRKRGAKRAGKSGIVVKESSDFAAYWKLLSARLMETYGTGPVHSLPEIEMLRDRFPEYVRLWAAHEGDEMVAGVVIHETDRVSRSQYIAANGRGQEVGALDLIFTELLSNYYADKPYFDFGTSDEEDGRRINKGLIDQKEGYGARVIAHEHYRIDVTAWRPGHFTEGMK